MLGGLEGVRHNYKAGKAIEGRKREGTKSVGCMRICRNDGFQLLGSQNGRTSVKKSMLCRFGAKDNHFHKSIEHRWTSFCLEVESRKG